MAIDQQEVIDSINEKGHNIPTDLTVLPLRDIIIYPNMIFPVLIGRASTLKAVADAVDRDKYIFVAAQKNPDIEEPGFDDIYEYGTIAKIIQVLKLPNNLLKVLVEGVFIGRIARRIENGECLEAEIEQVELQQEAKDKEFGALIRHTSALFAEYVKLNDQLPPDIAAAFINIDDPVRKFFYAAANTNVAVEIKQKLLEKPLLKDLYFELASILSAELELLKIEDEIDYKINDTIQKTQKKYYIQEQIRALQKEIGEDEDNIPEIQQLREAIENAGMPEHALKKANEELEKLKKTPSMSPDFAVNRAYLELLTAVPWHNSTIDDLNVENVHKVLEEDHYDLEKPKERILEFISVLNLSGSLKRQILCFVGPPGVGKTSLAKSISRALGRKFIRISLGGVRDEAEIRGHRRTYIGSMPGKIIQSMKKAETINPVILLDEIDKMSMDFRGDPSAALLEVLDPEQNITFNDHYLEVDYDLSHVLFITTANVLYDIPGPLRDRMEVIELSSYLDPDKLQIARRHILPKILTEYGMDGIKVEMTDGAIMRLITEYTKEAGVRSLERAMASVLRKLVRDIVVAYDKSLPKNVSRQRDEALKDNKRFKRSMSKKSFVIDEDKIEEYLRSPRYRIRKEDLEDKVGVANGLAWTSVGGDMLPIEVNMIAGTEKLTLTGKLGEVMQESAIAALSFIRANAPVLGVKDDFTKKTEIHIHAPEGAIPKDGPSAGITMTLALLSAVKGEPLRGDLAMTGEITLRGNILPIGGLKEKLLAAKKAGMKTVLIPKDNERDVLEISEVITGDLEIVPVRHLEEALPYAFRATAASSAT